MSASNGRPQTAQERFWEEARRQAEHNGTQKDAKPKAEPSPKKLDRNPSIPLRDTALEPVFARVPPQNIEAEQALLGAVLLNNAIMPEIIRMLTPSAFYKESHREIYKAMLRLHESSQQIDAITLANDLRARDLLEAIGGGQYLAEVVMCTPSAQHVNSYAEIVIEKALRRDAISGTVAYLEGLYDGNSLPELGEMAKRAVLSPIHPQQGAIIMMNQRESMALNQLYLARPEIIERLGYSESIMLIIGGKHHGKTTNIRTLGLAVCRGLPIWGRRTTQGPVLYMASDDELASSRNELLQMGWSENDPLQLGHINPDGLTDAENLIHEIAAAAIKMRAVMIVLDMLFDFASITDELSYAKTRAAIGRIQSLADETKCLVVCSHHTPKYLSDFHNASNAALGSQGISARFSPIVLTRKWSDNLYTVESTSTRDPRGMALEPIKIIKNEQGWIESFGEFEEWMKWEVYADRVMAVFEGGDPREGHTVAAMAKELDVDRARIQNALFQLSKLGKLKRERQGRGYKYYLANIDMFEREGGNFSNQ